MTNWEYWPLSVVYFPLIPVWLFFATRARKLFFFTAVNPSIPTGGFFGCSKMDILNRIPKQYVPTTILINKDNTWESTLEKVRSADITFPCIIKPDIGERGYKVIKVENIQALEEAYKTNNFHFIIQDYSPYELELAILCYRVPGTSESAVTSLCKKEFLTVSGDGTSNVRQLIQNNPRALLQIHRLEEREEIDLNFIPHLGQSVLLEPIGNHCRGTKFIDIQNLISPALQKTFVGILDQMEGVNYGRFDLKCASLDTAAKGESIHIFEFNGTASEPTHCYDPNNSIWYFYATMVKHWSYMYKIYKQQHGIGKKAMSISSGVSALKNYLKLVGNYN